MSGQAKGKVARRDFLKATAAATGMVVVKPGSILGTGANSAPALGIIGCGGRGHYIGRFFQDMTDARIVALADAFPDRTERLQRAFKVDASKSFAGLDAYKRAIDSGIDAVVIESPPYFHPEQAAAAVDAGKHVFLAKPVAVDAPGCQSIIDSGEKAKGKVSFLVDFQTRASEFFCEAAKRVHEGAIGAPVCGQIFYHTGRLNPQARPGGDEARLRNWVFDKVISGDIIVEQNIHVIDVSNWYLGSHPIKATGTGGRKARTDVGDCWDHFIVTYWYPNDVRIAFSSSQFIKGFHDMCMRIYGSAGTIDSHYNGPVKITGDNPWPGTNGQDDFRSGAIKNVKDFVASLKSGDYLNNAREAAETNLTCVLGRIAAYEEKEVTWDEMMRANVKLEAKLNL